MKAQQTTKNRRLSRTEIRTTVGGLRHILTKRSQLQSRLVYLRRCVQVLATDSDKQFGSHASHWEALHELCESSIEKTTHSLLTYDPTFCNAQAFIVYLTEQYAEGTLTFADIESARDLINECTPLLVFELTSVDESVDTVENYWHQFEAGNPELS